VSNYPELYEAAERAHGTDAATLWWRDGAQTLSAQVDDLVESLRLSGAREVARYLRTHLEYARAIRNLGKPVKARAIPNGIGTVVTFDPMVRP